MESPKPTAAQLTHKQATLYYLLLSVLFYSPIVLGQRTFPDGDFTHHFLPFSLFQQHEILSGRWPLWNPYTYSGHPFLADMQAALFYPINLLVLIISYPLEALFSSRVGGRLYFLQVEAIVHIALAGIFVYLFVTHLSRDRFGAFLAGITFAFSGYLTGYPPLQLAVLRTSIWLPVILLMIHLGIASPHQRRWWFGLVLTLSSAVLAGHPQTMLYIGYVAASWALFLLIQQWRNERNLLVLSVRNLLMAGLATAGLCAVQLLPSLEFTQMSVRAEASYDFVSAGFPLRDTWQLVLPGVFTWFSPLYIGIIGLGMAICAIGLLGKVTLNSPDGGHPNTRVRSIVLFWIIVTVVALLLSYGRNGFLYPLFYHVVPGWDLFRQQERAAYIVTFGLSVLAGLGYSVLTCMPIKRRRLLIAIYAVLVIATVYAFGLIWQVAGSSVISNLAYLGIAAGTLLAIAILGVSLWWEGWDKLRRRLLLLVALFNLLFVNFTTNLSEFHPSRKTILSPELEALEAVTHESSTTNVSNGRVYNEFRVYEDYGMRLKVEDVWGSSPLKLDYYERLFDEFPLDRMWQLTAVNHALTWRRELFEPSVLLAEFPQADDTTFLHRLAEPNPRAWFVPNVIYAMDDTGSQIKTLLADHNFDLENAAIVMQAEFKQPQIGQGSGLGLATSPPINAQIALDQKHPGHLNFDVTTNRDGFLVISENYMPGWQINDLLCDGAKHDCIKKVSDARLPPPFELQRANLAFIGLTIPAGHVNFDLTYRPSSFRLGQWISGGTLGSMIVLSLILLVRRRGNLA